MILALKLANVDVDASVSDANLPKASTKLITTVKHDLNSDSLATKTTILKAQLQIVLYKPPLNKDHLATKATILGSQGESLYNGLT